MRKFLSLILALTMVLGMVNVAAASEAQEPGQALPVSEEAAKLIEKQTIVESDGLTSADELAREIQSGIGKLGADHIRISAREDADMTPVATLWIKNTFIKRSALRQTGFGIDRYFAAINGNKESAVEGYVSTVKGDVALYDVDPESDYVVGKLGIDDVRDIIFAKNNINGEVLPDNYYDRETGLVYIRKLDLVEITEESVLIDNVQAQILSVVDDNPIDVTFAAAVNTDSASDDVIAGQIVESSLMDTVLRIVLFENGNVTEKITRSDLTVYVNGSSEPFDPERLTVEDGILTIDMDPALIRSVDIDVADGFFDKLTSLFTTTAYGATADSIGISDRFPQLVASVNVGDWVDISVSDAEFGWTSGGTTYYPGKDSTQYNGQNAKKAFYTAILNAITADVEGARDAAGDTNHWTATSAAYGTEPAYAFRTGNIGSVQGSSGNVALANYLTGVLKTQNSWIPMDCVHISSSALAGTDRVIRVMVVEKTTNAIMLSLVDTNKIKETGVSSENQQTICATYKVSWKEPDEVYGSIALNKKDKNSDQPITDAAFSVYMWNGTSYNAAGTALTHQGGGVYKASNLLINETNQGRYLLKETTFPSGYRTDSFSIQNAIWDSTLNGYRVSITFANPHLTLNAANTKRTYLTVQKQSADPALTDGNACYSLAGAEYSLYSDAACEHFVALFVTDATGRSNTLEIGFRDYWVKETKAPAGYKINETVYHVEPEEGTVNFVNHDNGGVVYDVPGSDPAAIRLIKKTNLPNAITYPLAGAKFEIKYYDTLDATLPAMPTRTWVIQTVDLGNDVYEAALDNPACFVSGDELYRTDGHVVLPIGTITVEEISPAPGYTLEGLYLTDSNGVTVTDGIYRTQITVNGGQVTLNGGNSYTMINLPVEVSTSVKGVSGQKAFALANNFSFTDTAVIKYLRPGHQYTIKGVLVNKLDGTPVNIGGSEIRAERTFTATSNTGEVVDLGFSIDSRNLAGASTVVFEYLYEDGVEIAKHTDLNDSAQTINWPTVSTRVHDANGGKNFAAVAGSAFSDSVSLTGLTPGLSYTVKGRLMDKSNGTVLATAQDVTFTATAASQTVEMPFTVDGRALAGKTTVVFESLYYGNTLLASHENINDADQTAVWIGISTEAKDAAGGKIFSAVDNCSFGDEVTLTGLAAGTAYRLHASLVDKSTGAEVASGDYAFTATAANQTVTVPVTLDASALAGKTTVFYETLYHGNDILAEHKDINDAAQTITWPSVRTSVVDNSGAKLFSAVDNFTFKDNVTMTGLIPGRSYSLRAVLVNKADGSEIATANYVFTAAAGSEQTVSVPVTVDAAALAGTSSVVYETLYLNNIEIASHRDINDADQTIVWPLVSTTAHDNAGGKNFAAINSYEFFDSVSLTGLVPGTQYALRGSLVRKSDASVIREVTETFTAVTSDMTVEVLFPVDAKALSGTETVVFEDLYAGDTLIASHRDASDWNQSVVWPAARTRVTAMDGSRVFASADGAAFKDNVALTGLVPGEDYVIKGVLVDKSTLAELATAEAAFTALGTTQTVEVPFTVDSAALAGTSSVVFETLYHGSDLMAEHRDINDADQTISWPVISTSVHTADGDRDFASSAAYIIVDTVHCVNLVPGVLYTVKGALMDKATGAPAIQNGAAVTATGSFVATATVMDYDLAFALNSEVLAGTVSVVFENLYVGNELIASHEDINDAAQTVSWPKITTAASDANGGNMYVIGDGFIFIDTVPYENLVPGSTYTLRGVLMDKATGEPVKIGGRQVEATGSFTAESPSANAIVRFTVDTNALRGKTTVVFESLYLGERLIAEHRDIDDAAQTIAWPDIDTRVTTESITSVEDFVLTDTVDLTNLTVGEEYVLRGVLMDKATGYPVEIDGRQVEGEKTFTATAADQSVEVTFDLDSYLIAGLDTVVFESLYRGGTLVVSHEDIDDDDQSVSWPRVTTRVQAKQIAAKEDFTIDDVVYYENLIPGREYTVTGLLMDKATGEPVMIGEEDVRSVKTFTPASPDGEINVTFTFNSAALAGKTLVCFEGLILDGEPVAAHTDIDDEAQTIRVPAIRTIASVGGEHADIHVAADQSVIDRVEYSGLVPGLVYRLEGRLVNKETGETVDGAEAVTEFTPKTASGTVLVEFDFSAADLRGASLVAFERLYAGNELLFVHEDINDADQTVAVPDIATLASDTETGKSNLKAVDGELRITDRVLYKNLTPGREYTLRGVLMDGKTGEPITYEKADFTAETTFTAAEGGGEASVAFILPSKALPVGKTTIVVFERLYDENNAVVEHTDIEDSDQTVIAVVYDAPKTGDTAVGMFVYWFLAAIAVSGLAALALTSSRRKKTRR